MNKPSLNKRWTGYLGWGLLGVYILTIVMGTVLQHWSNAPANVLGTYDTVGFGPPLLVMAVIGALIVARLPGHRIGWILIGLPLVFGMGEFFKGYAEYGGKAYPGALPFGMAAAMLAWGFHFQAPLPFALLFLLFPNGRLPSIRWRWLLWTVVGASALLFVGGILEPYPLGPERGPNPLIDPRLRLAVEPAFVLAFGLQYLGLLAATISMFLRLRSARGEARQQMKWFAYSLAFLPVGFGLIFFGSGDLAAVIGIALAEIAFIGMSAAIGIAIFKYRLYAIDVIINRSLIYGPLTAMLALMYAGSVIGLQALFQGLTGRAQSELVTVLSTLGIAAAFSPLRRRVQAFIDRRFYRKRYDARRILERFAATARDETDIERLSAALLGAIDDSLQPEGVGLWLREPEEGKEPVDFIGEIL